jgi:hypothetical protein
MSPIFWFLLGALVMAQLLDLFAFNIVCKKYSDANGWAAWHFSRERKKAYWPLGSLWLLLRA